MAIKVTSSKKTEHLKVVCQIKDIRRCFSLVKYKTWFQKFF
ncbi:unnamed protein product [Tenebrio molitor]|nr:unnamed protein product [Tenebrio molitor]